MTGDREPPRVELYLRSLAPATGRDHQDAVLERLRDLDEAGRIKGVDVRVCGDCVCPQSATARTAPGRRLLDRYEQFEAWADRTGADLAGFEHRDVESVLTGTTVTGVAFPRMVLAEYRRGRLAFVAPADTGEETVRVEDRVDTY